MNFQCAKELYKDEKFIMGEFQVGIYNGAGTGKIISFDELTEIFGKEAIPNMIMDMQDYCSALVAEYE